MNTRHKQITSSLRLAPWTSRLRCSVVPHLALCSPLQRGFWRYWRYWRFCLLFKLSGCSQAFSLYFSCYPWFQPFSNIRSVTCPVVRIIRMIPPWCLVCPRFSRLPPFLMHAFPLLLLYLWGFPFYTVCLGKCILSVILVFIFDTP